MGQRGEVFSTSIKKNDRT